MQYTITDKIKCFFICLFLLTTSYCVWDLTQFTKAKINESISIVENTKTQSLNEITAIRSDVFSYLYATNKQLDTRLNVIQKQTFSQIDSLQTSVLQRLDTTNNTISKVADNYSTIPTTINKFTNRFDAQTNCDINELCWQNLTTDLMIDTRNVVRDGATTFRLIDDNIPQLTKNTTDISGAIAKNVPLFADSVTKTADHIQRITKPHWYDRLFTYGFSGGLLYYNINKR